MINISSLRNYPHKLLIALCVVLVGFSSCRKFIYNNNDACSAKIRFVYDYNMKFADAFAHEVAQVDIFIFNEQDILVGRITEDVTPDDKDFLLTPRIENGVYSFLAWPGVSQGGYILPELTVGTTTYSDLRVQLETANKLINRELAPLWHGYVHHVEVGKKPNQEVVIPLIKNTNTFRINLLSAHGNKPIDINNYQFEIIADNGYYEADNSPIANNIVTYYPYYRQNISQSTVQGDTKYTTSVVELSTARIMDKAKNRLVVRSLDTKKILLDLSLNDLLLEYRLQRYSSMPAQEFFDREDSYAISFFFTEGTNPEQHFVSVAVMVNDWLVRSHNEVLGE